MTQRTRKLFGNLLIVLSIFVYCGLATWVYLALLQSAAWWVLIIFFAIAGMGWFVPAAWIIRWMARPDPQ